MTHPEGGSGGTEGISWVDIAGSAAGLYDKMRELGRGAAQQFNSAFREASGSGAVGGVGDSIELGYADAGTKAGRAFNRNLSAALKDGNGEAVAAIDGLKRAQDELTKANERATQVWTEWKKATDEKADLGVLIGLKQQYADATKAQTDATEQHAKAQADLEASVSKTSDSMGGSALAAGAMGGAMVAGAEVAIRGFEGMVDATTKVAEGLFHIGEVWEDVGRTLQATTTATGADLEGLEGIVGKVAANTSASFQDITAATATLAQRTGLRGGQLQQLTTDFVDAGKLIGKSLDPGAFTAAMNALGVPMDQADAYLTKLFGLSRSTSVPLNELVEAVAKNGAALAAFGIGADQSARLLAAMTAGGINSQSAIRGLTAVVTDAHKTHTDFATDLRDIVAGMEAAHKANDVAGEDRWAEKLGKGAEDFKTAVNNGVLSVESLSGALGDIPTDAPSALFDKTATLSDKLVELGHRIDTGLKPVGEALTAALGGAFDKVTEWLSTHGGDMVRWLTDIGVVGIHVFGVLEYSLGSLVQAFGDLQAGWAWLSGDDALKKQAQSAIDLGGSMMDAGRHIGDTSQKFKDFMAGIQQTVQVTEDLQAAIKLTSDGTGLQLKDNSKEVQDDIKALKQAGIDVTAGPDGQLHFTADTPENQQRVKDFLKETLGKDVDVPIAPKPTGVGGVGAPPADPGALFNIPPGGIKVPLVPVPAPPGTPPAAGPATSPPPDSFPSLPDIIGQIFTPPDWEKPGSWTSPPSTPSTSAPAPRPHTGREGTNAHPSDYVVPIPGQVVVQAADFTTSLPDVLNSAGIPKANQTDLGVAFPTGLPLAKSDDLDVDDLMSNAGITDQYQGDGDDGTQVQLPTGLHMSKLDRWLGVQELMDASGVPAENQGPTGVIIPASFQLALGTGLPGGAGAVPASFGTPAGGGSAGGPNWEAIAGAESGGNWQITTGEGTPDNPVSGGLQIGDKTWADFGGTAYGVPRAFMATKEQQIAIAQKILAGQGPTAWPTTYRNHPEWFTSSQGSSGTPIAPTGGTGDPSYAGVGAGDNSSTSNPQFGGIPGAPSGVGQDLLAYMKSVMDQFNAQTGSHLSVTADYPGGPTGHGDDGGDHSVRRALDISSGSQQEMDAFAAMVASSPELRAATRQLIHDDPGNTSIGTNDNIIGGHTTSGYSTYAQWMAQHRDHDHWALQNLPGPASNATANAVPADYTPTAPAPDNTTWTVDRTAPDPGTTPAPTAPGSSYASIPPPPDMPQAAAGAPGSIQTPFGNFQYTRDMPDQGMGLTPELREKFDTWLRQFEHLAEQQASTQQDIDDLQARLADGGDLAQKKADADTAAADPNAPPDDKAAAQAADREYADAQKQLAQLKRRQHDEQIDSDIAADKKPPWESSTTGKSKPDKNAETLGEGFLKGVMQELGFPDVFGGKSPDQWGITKLLTGGLGYGMGLLNQLGDKAAGTGGAAGTSSPTDSGGASFLEGLFPGLKTIMHGPNNGTPAGTPDIPGAPAPASNTPAGAGSSTPVVFTARDSGPGTTTNSNLHVYNQYNGFNPTPRVQDQVQQIAATTSAPAMSGGGGQLI